MQILKTLGSQGTDLGIQQWEWVSFIQKNVDA